MGCDGIMDGDEIYNGWLISNMPEAKLDKKNENTGQGLTSGISKINLDILKQPESLIAKQALGNART